MSHVKKPSSRARSQPRGLLDSEASLSRVTERKAVFNAIGSPASWRLPVPPPTQEFWAVTSYDLPAAITSSNAAEVDYGTAFTISAMNAAELAGYAAVFDQYRIRWVEVQILPRSNGVLQSSSSNPGRLVTAVDFDSSAGTTFANLTTFTNSLETGGSVSHWRAFEPCVTALAGASNGATGVASVAIRSPWLDLASTGIPHYGLKASVTTTDAAYVYDIAVRLHLAFRMKI